MTQKRHKHLAEATERLAQQDRVIMEARKLPSDRKLTVDEQGEIRQAVLDVAFDGRKRVIPNSKIAKETGYSASVISQVLNGTYIGANEKVLRDLNHWLERRARREASTRPDTYVKTHVAEMMRAIIAQAHRRNKMAAIVSPAGSGKDMVIEAVAERYNAVVVYADEQSMTPRELLLEIAGKLNIRMSRGSIANLRRAIVDAVRGHDRMIIVNEAQQLRPQCASVIRAIYDLAETPIVLIGSDRIFELIDDRSSGGGQFSRRCIRLNVAERLSQEPWGDGGKSMGRPLFTKDEIQQWLAKREIQVTREGFDLACLIANTIDHGTFGLMADVVETAADLTDKPLKRNDLLSALTMLVGEGEFTRVMRSVRDMDAAHLEAEEVAAA